MPTPIGHMLAGVATAWSAEPPQRKHRLGLSPLTRACALLAALPDADLVYPPVHRTFSHSLGAALVVAIIAAAVTRWVTRRGAAALRMALVCGAAYGSHVLLDWLGR